MSQSFEPVSLYCILLICIETAGPDEGVNPVDAREGETSAAGQGSGNLLHEGSIHTYQM